MAKLVSEIMNPEPFGIRPGEAAQDALGYILSLGITGAPVIDEAGRAVGMLSLRDLVDAPPTATARDRMTGPIVVVRGTSSIGEAGRLMADTGYHRLVVVDENEAAVGLVSALDVVRGLLGLPATHPPAFRHHDRRLGLAWTEDTPLDADRVEAAPAGPGVLLLIDGGPDRTERVVWGEASGNVRARLLDMIVVRASQSPVLAALLLRSKLRFRAAATHDVEEARRSLPAAMDRSRGIEPRATAPR